MFNRAPDHSAGVVFADIVAVDAAEHAKRQTDEGANDAGRRYVAKGTRMPGRYGYLPGRGSADDNAHKVLNFKGQIYLFIFPINKYHILTLTTNVPV